MLNSKDLYDQLLKLDGRDYKACKSIKGDCQFSEFILIINYVQSDPFAALSKVFVKVPQSIVQFPPSHQSPSR